MPPPVAAAPVSWQLWQVIPPSQAGTVELVGADKARTIAGVARLLEDDAHYQAMSRA